MIRPGNLAVDMWVSLAGLPQVGRNLFDSPGWQEIRALRESGIDLIAVIDNSRYPTASSSANGSGRMARLIAHQGEQPLALKELPFAHNLRITVSIPALAAALCCACLRPGKTPNLT